MKFDKIAIEMLRLFIDNDNLTSTFITNSIFNPKSRENSLRKNNLIIGRLKTWVKKGIIVNGTMDKRTAHYNLNMENLKIGKLFLDLGDGDIEELGEHLVVDVNGMHRFIVPKHEL